MTGCPSVGVGTTEKTIGIRMLLNENVHPAVYTTGSSLLIVVRVVLMNGPKPNSNPTRLLNTRINARLGNRMD